jgi:hypothetical protein
VRRLIQGAIVLAVVVADGTLWRGLLRTIRGRFAMLDAARDLATGLPSKFALRNFLDRSYAYVAGYPMPGFNAMLGLRVGL